MSVCLHQEATDTDEVEKNSNRGHQVVVISAKPLKINIFHSISWSDTSSLKGGLEDN